MPNVSFTNNLKRHVTCPRVSVSACTVRGALSAVFEKNPNLGGYILDDQERPRKHIAIFVDGVKITGPDSLDETLNPDAEIFVLQALSGG